MTKNEFTNKFFLQCKEKYFIVLDEKKYTQESIKEILLEYNIGKKRDVFKGFNNA